ncbi:SKA complex subunit 1-like [Littorina saxatilis]|uniref:SKA complex subunit 1 n=1 Tax=Littorina saxatilis TaxID=31220 RepID=A0AAN9C9F2_9CAEN
MDSRSFEELSQHFTEKLSRLTESLAIQSCLDSADEEIQEEGDQSMLSLWQQVDDLTAVLTLVKNKCTDQRTVLTSVDEVKERLSTLVRGVQHTHSNIPSHLPVTSAPSSHQSPVGEKSVQDTAPAPTPLGSGHPQCVQAGTKNVSSVGNKRPPPCPLMEYLTVDEFDDVPKYMKGRLSYQQANTVVDELNKAFTAKYKLMKIKKSTMNDSQRKRWDTLKMQESKDTKGVFFLVEDDIKEWSSLKMSKETRTFLTLLRHCGRLCEIRGGGHVRYALIEIY